MALVSENNYLRLIIEKRDIWKDFFKTQQILIK